MSVGIFISCGGCLSNLVIDCIIVLFVLTVWCEEGYLFISYFVLLPLVPGIVFVASEVLMLWFVSILQVSHIDDSNDFSLNVVKYRLWSVEWDSWYLNSGCWFSFFPSRVFTEVSHHCWGLSSDKIWGRVLFCCLKAFFVLFLAFLHGVPCAERYIHRILYPGSIFVLFSVWWVCAALRAACAILGAFKLLGVLG